LRITEEHALEEKTKYTNEMLVAPVPVIVQSKQAGIPKSIVLDLGQFNGDRTKFKDWWRGVRLFLKSNRVTGINNRITAILA